MAGPGAGGAPPVARTRSEALAWDSAEPLHHLRDRFVVAPGPIYLDGNSLGRPPADVVARLGALVEAWADRLIGGWDEWIELPGIVGDRIGRLVGAAQGQVVVSDSTTVNLYKLVAAALDARPDRDVVVVDPHDFATVRYVLQGLAEARRIEVRFVASDPVDGIDASGVAEACDERVAVVCLSAVNYRSGARVDLAAAAEAAHAVGALVCWDLSHAAGAVPVELDRSGADLAVGCGYKYLNGGPGAPAWLYVREELQSSLRQPIWGWWGQRDQFAMGERYDPVAGPGRFLAGTPPVLGLVALDAGVGPLVDAGPEHLWAKAQWLSDLTVALADELLVPLGATLASSRDPERRGPHVGIAHPGARSLCRRAIDAGLVVGDFRPPDVLRLAPVPAYTRAVDVWDAVHHLADLLGDPAPDGDPPPGRIT